MGVHIHINQGNGGGSTPAELAVSITHADLKALRDSGTLVTGTWYRITDYLCSTTQNDTQAAQHQFDIIVQALDESHLSEEAYAAHHEGDTYFENCKLEAWKLKYCLDNDTNRFGWAADGSGGFWVEYEDKDTIRLMRTAIIEGKDTVWQYGEGKDLYYSAPDPVAGDYIYSDESLSENPIEITAVGEISGEPGTGVVYYMMDEFGNECHYDFKNIMFKRFEITAVKDWEDNTVVGHDLVGKWGLPNYYVTVDDQTSEWFYTFSSINDNTVTDASLAFDYNPVNGQGSGAGLNRIESMIKGSFRLNNIVFINDSGNLLCYSNQFGTLNYDMTFGNGCYSMTFGNSCRRMTFGNYCYNSTFGNECYYMTFGNSCNCMTFGNGCYSMTFGNSCNCMTFGNNNFQMTFGNDCYSMTFGNNNFQMTFGNYCNCMTFGNGCGSMTFGNNNFQMTFGNGCYSMTFGNYCRQITVFEGVRYCTVTGGTDSSSYVQNAQILNGVAGSDDNSRLSISFTENVSYTQVAAFDSNGTLRIYAPADAYVS